MADTNDTIADIIPEMRDEAARADMEQDYSIDDAAEMMREFAWRIDAAHKRERGDAAKLREALCESRRIASDLGGCRLNDYWKLNEIVRVCEAALAAPPRNCDVYSHDEALQVWASEKGNEHNGCFDEWLYEIAKEGGAK